MGILDSIANAVADIFSSFDASGPSSGGSGSSVGSAAGNAFAPTPGADVGSSVGTGFNPSPDSSLGGSIGASIAGPSSPPSWFSGGSGPSISIPTLPTSSVAPVGSGGASIGAGLGGIMGAPGTTGSTPIGGTGGSSAGPAGTAPSDTTPPLSGPNPVPGSQMAAQAPTAGADANQGLAGSITGAPVQSTLPGSVGAGAASPQTISAPATPATISPVTDVTTTGPPVAPDTRTPLQRIESGISSVVGNRNFLPTLAYGADLIAGNRQSSEQRALTSAAQREAAQGQALSSYVNSGTLPPGMQMFINSAADSARATVRSQYAARGMSGSSAEAQDLEAVGERAAGQSAEMAMKLLQQGVQLTGMSDQLYAQLLGIQEQHDAAFSTAVGNLTSALATSATPAVPTGT